MEMKELGATGVMIPEIGLGFWRYQGGQKPIHKGIELGASLLDTAEIYGTEELVAEAIEKTPGRVFIATKVSGDHLTYDDVLRAADTSLKRLRTSVIDLYQIHWPNPAIPIRETMRAMESLVDRGIVRFIGVSQFSLGDLCAAQAIMRNHPIVSNQVRYNLNWRRIEADLLAFCQKHKITIIAYTPLDDGRLAQVSGPVPANRRMQVLGAIAREVVRTPVQVALNWCTAHRGVVAIPKSNSVERTIENCNASGWRLSPSQMRRLNTAFSWNIRWMRAKTANFLRQMRGRESVLNQS
jgi:diketogulonate reductase-like aldo/keto reductase